ncbi:hypothetical protein ACIBSR_12675 [Streptomyces sp. NPDC049936]
MNGPFRFEDPLDRGFQRRPGDRDMPVRGMRVEVGYVGGWYGTAQSP